MWASRRRSLDADVLRAAYVPVAAVILVPQCMRVIGTQSPHAGSLVVVCLLHLCVATVGWRCGTASGAVEKLGR